MTKGITLKFTKDILNALNSGEFNKASELIHLWQTGKSVDNLIENFMELYQTFLHCSRQTETEHDRLISAIEQSKDVILITDAHGDIKYANPAFTVTTGYTLDEAIGQNPRILKSGLQDDDYYKRLWETISAGKPWTGRFINKTKNGDVYVEDANISPVRGEHGEIESYVAVKRDVTEILKLEEEREILENKLNHSQKMEAVGRLAGGIAHDFNNMLNVILGYTELSLKDLPKESWLTKNLLQIQAAGQRSADLTKQLLIFSRKQTVEPVLLDLNNIINENLKMLERMIGEEIMITFSPGENLHRVKMDRSQFDQILANLSVNARDAIERNGLILIETENILISGHDNISLDLPDGEYVRITFGDNGSGIDTKDINHIFEPFYTTKDLGKGTGLGLATIYGIVLQNSGDVCVESVPGVGSLFTIYLPAAKEPLKRLTPEPETVRRISSSGTILVVEDEPQILEFVSVILENAGYKVMKAVNPLEAIKICNESQGQINLLLTDIVMPEMNGKELRNQVLHIIPDIKVLFMSGYTSDIIARNGIIEEGTDFIHKPFQLKTLLNKISTILAGGTAPD